MTNEKGQTSQNQPTLQEALRAFAEINEMLPSLRGGEYERALKLRETIRQYTLQKAILFLEETYQRLRKKDLSAADREKILRWQTNARKFLHQHGKK